MEIMVDLGIALQTIQFSSTLDFRHRKASRVCFSRRRLAGRSILTRAFITCGASIIPSRQRGKTDIAAIYNRRYNRSLYEIPRVHLRESARDNWFSRVWIRRDRRFMADFARIIKDVLICWSTVSTFCLTF